MQLGRDFVKALHQIEEEKGLPVGIITSSLEAALISAYRKHRGGNQNVEVNLDLDREEISLFEVRRVVAEGVDPDTEMSLTEARSLGYHDVDPGDVVRIEVFPEGFGRIAAQTARQVIIQQPVSNNPRIDHHRISFFTPEKRKLPRPAAASGSRYKSALRLSW